MAIDYTLHQGESIAAYNSRIAAARAAATPTPSIGKDGTIQNINTSTLSGNSTPQNISGFDAKTLMAEINKEVGAVTSSADTIDAGINAAIQSQKDAAAANQQYLESYYGRESATQWNNLQNQRTSILEGSRGGAYNAYALEQVDQSIEKSMRDLDQRKNELILQGNAAAASKISELQVQQMQMKVDLQQKKITNLMGLGQLGIQIEESLQNQANAARTLTMDQLRYNLDVQKQKDYVSMTQAQLAQEAIKTNIMKLEYNMKAAEYADKKAMDKLAADAGFASIDYQNTIVASINAQLAELAKTSAGKTEEQLFAEKLMLANRMNNQFGDSVATPEAINMAVYGFKSEDDYMASREQVQIDTNSGDYRGLVGLFPNLYSAGQGLGNALGYGVLGKYWTPLK